MQFKKLLFLIISALLLLIGCDSKEENKPKAETETSKEKEIQTKYQLETLGETPINLTYKNETLNVDEVQGKVILVNFFATWCPPCKAEIPHLINLKNKYKDNFEIIAVNLGEKSGQLTDKSVLADFANEYKINYIVTNSENNFKIADLMGGVRIIPTMYLFDPKGTIVQKYVGIVPEEMIETDIKKALGK
ncbi:TlpA family protein disulfide reductase [Arcobacter arenosus]|jgi:thiol-disulfide isomerase/thioredoxin|uniref:TlpA family protein disulfide reductase n=1 Tax=Arcobacter arenosus TaxID=2576037 RepID=A0A5R8Y048_9BACT|nr:TlpA disulfide reductase family protein [Arcobacter arenosus]TLP37631.1 TlpA family protein disulfide reductase [Arcobacter arenosus]